MRYYDTETESIITRDQLETEFNAKSADEKAEYNNSFGAWLRNCLDSTLEKIDD